MNDLSEFHSLLDMFEKVEDEHGLDHGSILASLVDEHNSRVDLEAQKERKVYEH